MYKGAIFRSESTVANHKLDDKNYSSKQLASQSLLLPFFLQQKTVGSYTNTNGLIVQRPNFSIADITSGLFADESDRPHGKRESITVQDVSTSGSTSNNLVVTVNTTYALVSGVTSSVTITSNPGNSYSNGDTVKVLGSSIGGSSPDGDIAFTVRFSATTGGNGVLDRIHPSRVIEAFQVESQGNDSSISGFVGNKTSLHDSIYYPSRVVFFDKYALDRGTSGSSNSPHTLNIPSIDGMCMAVADGPLGVKIDAKTSGARFSSVFSSLFDSFGVGVNNLCSQPRVIFPAMLFPASPIAP